MLTYACQNIITALIFIFTQAIIHSWFAFIFFSFFKIAFEKSIRLPTLLLEDYSICNDIALSEFVWLILANADSKLLK